MNTRLDLVEGVRTLDANQRLSFDRAVATIVTRTPLPAEPGEKPKVAVTREHFPMHRVNRIVESWVEDPEEPF